jgi:PiT family inorganic phosphate transporter
VISSAIVGAGSAERANMVRWGLAAQIATAWLLTIPATMIMGGIIYLLLVAIL